MRIIKKPLFFLFTLTIFFTYLNAITSWLPNKSGFVWYLQHSDSKIVTNALKDIFKKEVKKGKLTIVSSDSNNAVVIKGKQEILKECGEFIKRIDVNMGQVLISVLVTEMSIDKNNELGFEWNYSDSFLGQNHVSNNTLIDYGNINSSVSADLLRGLKYTVTNTDKLKVLLQTLQQQNKLDIISSPRILATNNKEANLLVGEEVPVITKTYVNDKGTLINSYETKKIGIELKVTPHINVSGNVTLKILQKVNDILEYDSTNKTVRILNREANTVVTLKDGQTIVIGGFIKNNRQILKSKVPVMGDIPLLGKLFERKKVVQKKTELMVFITPKIINSWLGGDIVTETEKGFLTDRKKVDNFLSRLNRRKKEILKPDEVVILRKGSDNWLYAWDVPGIKYYFEKALKRLFLPKINWQEGQAAFGYGPSVDIKVSYRTKLKNGALNYVFKRIFYLDNPQKYQYFRLTVASDDAAIVYLNGKLVDYDPDLNKKGGHNLEYWNRWLVLKPSHFRKGKNEIVILVKNCKNSSDAFFDMELVGKLKKKIRKLVKK